MSCSETSSLGSRPGSAQAQFSNLPTSSPKVEVRGSGGDKEDDNSYTFNSLDSPKVLMGPNLGDPSPQNPFR